MMQLINHYLRGQAANLAIASRTPYRRGRRLFRRWYFSLVLGALIGLAACGPSQQVTRLEIPPTQIGAGAPVYTQTPTFTPSFTPTITATPTASFTPTNTPTSTASFTPTSTPTLTPTHTPSPTDTPPPSPTVPLYTPTPLVRPNLPPPARLIPAETTANQGWSCGDFPCETDIAGFLARIQVPPGFSVAHEGQFPGLVMQIAYGPDERLYATVLENGTRNGAVYAMQAGQPPVRYSTTLISPVGLAFQPGTDVLYVTARTTLEAGGALYRVQSDGTTEEVLADLPCCFQVIGNQPNGLAFGPDGLLYMGIGALTDRLESPNPEVRAFLEPLPDEAAVLRINPHTGAIETFADGIRNPYDIAFSTAGHLYASDIGLVTGEGDRLLQVAPGANYGWPYYRNRGCEDCPPRRAAALPEPDLVRLPDYTLPHGLTVYTGSQFPANMYDTLFVALWNDVDWGQRIAWINPDEIVPGEPAALLPFVTGLIRPIDVTVAPDGALVVADHIYGHVWRVTYTRTTAPPQPEAAVTQIPLLPISTTSATTEATRPTTQVTPTQRPSNAGGFVTNTPAP